MDAKKRRLESPSRRQHRLLQALSLGVVALLSNKDAARVLSTCSAIRLDEAVVSCALRSATQSPRWRVADHRLVAGVATSAYAKMLQVAWHMDEHLTAVASPTSTKGTGIVQGVLLLTDVDTTTLDTTLATALSACRLTAAPARSSRFKAHCDHLSESHGTIVCALCEAAVDSVCSYREGAERFANDLEEKVLRAEDRWEAEGRSASEIFELSYDFQQACMENEPFYDPYVANRNDESVLSHVVASGRFPVDSHSGCPGDLMSVLDGRSREACREVYQPLRRQLAAMCDGQVLHAVALTADSQQVDVVAGCVACGLSSKLLVGCVVME